jgi:hypothetical protein
MHISHSHSAMCNACHLHSLGTSNQGSQQTAWQRYKLSHVQKSDCGKDMVARESDLPALAPSAHPTSC